MFSPRTNRRILLVALVAIAGCASLDQCGMRTDYTTTEPIAPTGSVTFAWAFDQGFPDSRYGESLGGVIRMAGQPPDFNDVCGLAKLGHEVAHEMKGRHQ